MIPSKLNIHVKNRTIHMDIFIFFINFADIFKIYIQYGYHKDCRGGKLLNGERKAG